MTGFKCNVTGSTSNVPLAKPQVPRRCGADPANGVMKATPGNCTYGAKNPFYWFQAERNNVSCFCTSHEPQPSSDRYRQMNEGTYAPPFYTDLYNFRDGAQDDIFQDSYDSIPVPSPQQTLVPQPNTPASGGGTLALPSSSSPLPSSSSLLPSSSSPVPYPVSSPSSLASSPTPGCTHLTPSSPSPSSMVSGPPYVTVTTTVFVTQLPPTSTPSSSTGTPVPSPPGVASNNPNVISLNKRKPMSVSFILRSPPAF